MALAITVSLAVACGGTAYAVPQIGYVYPAGGQQGTTFTVEVGGQQLRDVDQVRVSGSGVRVSVVEYVRELDNDERRDTERFLRDLLGLGFVPGHAHGKPVDRTPVLPYRLCESFSILGHRRFAPFSAH